MKAEMSTIIAAAILIGLLTGLVGAGQSAFANEHNVHEHEISLSLPSLIRPLGICALSSLLITFFTGLFRRKLGKRFLGIHKVFAFITAVIALSHGTLVLLLF
jgi:hypothetical protein